MQSLARGLLLVSLAFVLVGCGSSGSSLSGTVTYDGVPVAKGNMTLQPADGKGEIAGAEIVDGKFTVTNLTPGKKIVTISSSQASSGPISSGDAGKATAQNAADQIPANAQGNGQQIEVKSGSQTQDFALKKPA